MPKSTLKTLPALIVAITAALLTQPMRAGAIDTLVITENSSTSLTAILNGNPVTVTPNGADHWLVGLLPGVSGVTPFAVQAWVEPGAAGFFNTVVFDNHLPGMLIVTSDDSPGQSGLADGTPDTTTFTLNGNPLSVTFFDKGDVAAVPDTGTTASLFGLSLTGLAFLRRKFC